MHIDVGENYLAIHGDNEVMVYINRLWDGKYEIYADDDESRIPLTHHHILVLRDWLDGHAKRILSSETLGERTT